MSNVGLVNGSTHTFPTVADTATEILAEPSAGVARFSLVLANIGANTIWITWDDAETAPVATTGGFILAASGGTLSFPLPGTTFVPQKSIQAICASGLASRAAVDTVEL
jgi:hypothetical protein